MMEPVLVEHGMCQPPEPARDPKIPRRIRTETEEVVAVGQPACHTRLALLHKVSEPNPLVQVFRAIVSKS